jgi:putative transposase
MIDLGRGCEPAHSGLMANNIWKKKYGNLGVSELRQLRQLRDENARLKRLVADLTLDRHILQEVLKKKT